jgi:nucleotide-binding universal stress UspA family protein
MKNILVPTDFSNNAFKALAYAAGLANHCGASVHIVHAFSLLENVLLGRSSMRESWNETRRQEKAAALLQVQQDIAERYPALKFETHLFSGPTGEVLLKYCETARIDLVIMGKHGAEGLGRIFMGSTTAFLIGKSHVPVMAIPEKYELKEPTGLVLATRDFERDTRLTDPVFAIASLFDLSVQVLVFAEENQVEANIMRRAAELADYVAWLRQHYPNARISGSHSEGDDLDLALSTYCEKNGIGILCMLTHHRGFWDSILDPSKTKEMAFRSSIPLLAIPV